VPSSSPSAKAKALGDLNNGTYSIGLSSDAFSVNPGDVITFNYLIVNSGHASQQEIIGGVTKAGDALAGAAATAAATAVGANIGAAVGAELGTAVVPIIGSALGALGGWLVGGIVGILFPNCDGPVAAELIALTGVALATNTANNTAKYLHTTFHPGTDSAVGCGSNSKYNVTWSVRPFVPLNGTSVQLYDNLGPGQFNQQWQLVDVGDGWSRIVCRDGGRVIDAEKPNVGNNGCRIQVWDYLGDGQTNQHWRIVDVGDGWSRFECRASGKVLDAEKGNVQNNGCRIQLWDYLGSNQYNQHWKVYDAGGGWSHIVCRESGKVLDAQLV